MNRILEIFVHIISLPLILSLLGHTAAAQNRQEDAVIRFGLTSSLIEADVNINDALAATKVWASAMSKGIGLWTTTDAVIYENAAALMAAVNAGETDVVALGTHEYLEIQDSLKATPMLTYLTAGQVGNQYLVLVHRDSPFRTIGDLRNQRIVWMKAGRNTMIPLWLDVLLNENGIRESQKFFREVKDVQKPSQAILPIFFKQIESGIVLKSSFDTAAELNPQVGQQLRVLAASPKYVMLVVCMRSTLSPDKRDQYVRQALKLHETPSGLQSFAIFKLDRLIPWNPSYFDNVRELLNKRKSFRPGTQLQAHSNTLGEAEKRK
jgi:ABC-type phosphate/phosphonate transport system substrate-binding protein